MKSAAAVHARWLTAVALAVLGLLVLMRQRDSAPAIAARPAVSTPQNTVYSMLDAARSGDVPKYLDHYTGELAGSIRRAAAEQGELGFAQYLRQTNELIKGIAVNEPERIGEREVKLRVELVYGDRNEAQIFHLERPAGGEWKIKRLEAAERVQTLVPYGAPVAQ